MLFSVIPATFDVKLLEMSARAIKETRRPGWIVLLSLDVGFFVLAPLPPVSAIRRLTQQCGCYGKKWSNHQSIPGASSTLRHSRSLFFSLGLYLVDYGLRDAEF